MRRTWQLAIVAVTIGITCFASAKTGMKTVVNVLESRYAVHHHGVPGLWLAKPFLFVSGIGSLKMAEFGKLRLSASDVYPLKATVEQALGLDWSPLVETWSKSDGEWSFIFAQTAGAGFRILIVSSDQDDGLSLIQVNVSGRAVRLWLDEPGECAQRVSGRRSKEADTREIASGGVISSQSGSVVPAVR